ncbi:MAG: DNA-binding protein [Gemmatimonadaceae bacterium]|nr:DNA-binding protein [Gemmatimonadaceae bacterium]
MPSPKSNEKTHPNAVAFPAIGGPALRALATAGITSMASVAKWRERDLLALHGMGPKGVRMLKDALAGEGRSFRAD